jgi:hypothetical protein
VCVGAVWVGAVAGAAGVEVVGGGVVGVLSVAVVGTGAPGVGDTPGVGGAAAVWVVLVVGVVADEVVVVVVAVWVALVVGVVEVVAVPV